MAGQPKPVKHKELGKTIFLHFKLRKMQTQKMSLVNIQGKLSRSEMKNIIAGSGSSTGCFTNGTACGGGKTCKSSGTSCLCGTSDDGTCYKA